MLHSILTNLLYIAFAFGIFALCVIANIVASVYYNTTTLKQAFNRARFFDGILKMLSIGLTTAILAVVITLLPPVAARFGLVMPDGAESVYTIGAIFILYFNAVKKYFTEAYRTVKDILEKAQLIGSKAEYTEGG